MKNRIAFLIVLVIIIVAIVSFKPWVGGTVRGIVFPSDAAKNVWALSGRDTFRTTTNTMGVFEINHVRAGTYRIMVEANPPYKNVYKDNITVRDSTIIDAGDFRLSQ